MSELGPQQRQLVFRKFALQELSLPAVMANRLAPDQSRDFLALSLGSFEQHLELTSGLKRSSGAPFVAQAGYLDVSSPDARAAQRSGVHLLAFHVGLGAAMFEFSLFVMSQRHVLHGFGDASSEASPGAIDGYPPGFWMREEGAVLDSAAFLNTATKLIPNDPRRYEIAVMLCILMMRFVWFHELYHAVNGHIGLVDRQGMSLGFDETKADSAPAIEAAALSLLELDADQSALKALCGVGAAGIENVEGLRHMPIDEHLGLCLFAAYASTWMLDEYLRRRDQSAPATHPLPSIRRQNLIRSFAGFAPALQIDPEPVHDRVLGEMTALAKVVRRFPSGGLLLAEMHDTTIQCDLDARQDALAQLRDQLTPYRYT